MLYRELGKTKEKVSVLGLGTMRLPTINSNGNIDKKKASEILSYGIDNGINLIDTAYTYHADEFSDEIGNCEPFLGEFLSTGYREKILLSTKSPSWLIKNKEDFDFYLNDQLKRLQTDNLDIYLLHTLTKEHWENLKSCGVFEFMDRILEEGIVKHIGFSSHTEFDILIDILDSYDKWEVAMTQMNFIDENYQSGLDGLKYLNDINVGNIIMEPLRGGRLVQNIPDKIMNIWNTADVKRTPVEWALDYLWDMEAVDCVLSGMTSLEQLKANIEIANNSKINSISSHDKEVIKEVAREYNSGKGNDCTQCMYCMPCPEGVNIPQCFKEYNIATMFNNPSASAMQYFSLINEDERAENCTKCNKCLQHCPQIINIPEELEKVQKLFGNEFNHY
ncbi:aldo/keto reductase [Methanobrevibacter sp. DSM 116169]|uniref:aldo/keto reductase n=1 Tax=Methanobrevibacter sp. DSM 116169 TaxID=3242727 RepID=UPI0038FC910C